MGHYAPMPRGRWVLTSLIPLGWVTWAGFLFAGFRAKQPLWVAAGFAVGGFSSLEDLGMTMDLPGDVVEQLRGRVVCIPR